MHERKIVYTAQFIEPCEGKVWSYARPLRWRLIWVGDSRKPTQLLTSLDVKHLSAWLPQPEFSFFSSLIGSFQFQFFIRVWVPSYQEIWLLDIKAGPINKKVGSMNKLLSKWFYEGNGVNEGG